jgi:hypothetical protein
MRNPGFPLSALMFLALLTSCVGPAERTPPPAPPPAPAQTPTPPPAPLNTEWQHRPATPGDWTYRTDGSGSSAHFASASGGPLLSLRCDRASHRVSLARAGTGSGAMTIRTSYGAVSWPASVGAGNTPETVATRAANDAVLDQIAYSRGRFGVEIAGTAPLILPAWAEVARVIEDCRG